MIIELINYGIVALGALIVFCGIMGIRSLTTYEDYEEFSFYLKLIFVFTIVGMILKVIQEIIIRGVLCIC